MTHIICFISKLYVWYGMVFIVWCAVFFVWLVSCAIMTILLIIFCCFIPLFLATFCSISFHSITLTPLPMHCLFYSVKISVVIYPFLIIFSYNFLFYHKTLSSKHYNKICSTLHWFLSHSLFYTPPISCHHGSSYALFGKDYSCNWSLSSKFPFQHNSSHCLLNSQKFLTFFRY